MLKHTPPPTTISPRSTVFRSLRSLKTVSLVEIVHSDTVFEFSNSIYTFFAHLFTFLLKIQKDFENNFETTQNPNVFAWSQNPFSKIGIQLNKKVSILVGLRPKYNRMRYQGNGQHNQSTLQILVLRALGSLIRASDSKHDSEVTQGLAAHRNPYYEAVRISIYLGLLQNLFS